MTPEQFHQQMEALEHKHAAAQRTRDAKAEIEALMQMGALAGSAVELGMANMRFDLAARVIRNTNTELHRLHEALGERGLILRRMKQFPTALELLKQAVTAAQEHAGPMEQGRWLGSQGGVHRLLNETELARQAFEQALAIFRAQGDAGRAGAANQEGNLGLLARDSGDDESAEQCYRRAMELAKAAGSADVPNTWATNLGKALARRRRYHEAWNAFEQALTAARQRSDEPGIISAAENWSDSYRQAHQWRQAGESLINAANLIDHPAPKCALLERSLNDLGIAWAWERLRDVATELAGLLEQNGADPQRKANCDALRETARQRLDSKAVTPAPDPNGPTRLDSYIPAFMSRYEKAGNAQGFADVAHLICDVSLGLMSSTVAAWKPFLTDTALSFRVLGDAMMLLCKQGLPEQSLELSQRFKSLGFCGPNLHRLRESGAPHAEARAYLKSLDVLSAAVAELKGPSAPDDQLKVQAVRAAGELLLESGEKLRDRDPMLHAKLGGLIRPRDLIDALPAADPVAIVDLFVTGQGTLIHVLIRDGNRVRVFPNFAEHFTAKEAGALWEAWHQGRIPHEISERQRHGLIKIGRVLHDRIMCSLAKQILQLGAAQIIFVPDAFTESLPLHVSAVCGEELHVRGVDTKGAAFLGEVFPVEYAPCLQAIAVSQHQKRPANVSRIVSFDDPRSDLPGARHTAKWLGKTLPKSLRYESRVGKQAKLKHLTQRMSQADIVVIGTHGVFNPDQPAESHLVFHDGAWTLRDMMNGAAFAKRPVIVLSACEIGSNGYASEITGKGFRNGIPGALISAGAASVLAALWPVEDVSMGYIVERFLAHLSHKGFRPAAALFRALRDVRSLSKADALQRCRGLMEEMIRDGTDQTLPEQFYRLDQLAVWIEDIAPEQPFASPQFWGSVVIVGSGWHLPAGAVVTGGAASVTQMLEDLVTRQEVEGLIAHGRFQESISALEKLLARADGMERARLLDMMAAAVWGNRRPGAESAARKEAMDLLAKAEQLARDETAGQLLRNIRATKQKIMLWKED